MKHNLLVLLVLLTFIFLNIKSLKLKNTHHFKYNALKQVHKSQLTNFTFATINAKFNGASGSYFNDRLVSIQFKFIDKYSGEERKSQKFGPNWGTSFDWTLNKESQIKSVQFWRDDFMVNGLQFITNKSEKSPVFGVQDGLYESQDLKNKEIIGLQGVYCGGGIRILELILSQ